ncbi:hypothetical protein IFM89_007578 [Coptis chinensis]|uniref:Myb/SANT-like domain-containing protein n=1 Tax=Coptis chinensis TaxID=261450 RepID=A0A835GY91_9MAGN|nr:hypothetical protein IFM89_007578 [Coptis chinensis]
MRRTTHERRAVAALVLVIIAQAMMAYYDWWYRIYMTKRRVVRAIPTPIPRAPCRNMDLQQSVVLRRQGHNSSKGKHVVTECEVTKPPAAMQKQVTWYSLMDEILIEVLLEKTLNGLGKKSNNGWKPETLKEVAKAMNQRLNMSIGSENVRSWLKTMKKDYLAAKAVVEDSGFDFSYNQQTKGIDADHMAWKEYCKMFPHFEEACVVFESDVATGEGGKAGHDNEKVVILDEEVGDERADNIKEESSQPPSPHPNENDVDSSQGGESLVAGCTSQAGSHHITTPPLVKRKRSRLGLEAMPPPPYFKELTEAVRQLTSAFNLVEPTTLLLDVLGALPNMEPDIMLRAFDLLGENEQLLKVLLGISNPQFQYAWLMRKLQQ